MSSDDGTCRHRRVLVAVGVHSMVAVLLMWLCVVSMYAYDDDADADVVYVPVQLAPRVVLPRLRNPMREMQDVDVRVWIHDANDADGGET